MADAPERKQRMLEELMRRKDPERIVDVQSIELDREAIEHLRSLGYFE